jgi:hypothetical protein
MQLDGRLPEAYVMPGLTKEADLVLDDLVLSRDDSREIARVQHEHLHGPTGRNTRIVSVRSERLSAASVSKRRRLRSAAGTSSLIAR